MGRAARHVEGHAVLYADNMTGSMKAAMDEITRRRRIQEAYNLRHGITPQSIRKVVKDITERVKAVAEPKAEYEAKPVTKEELVRLIKDLEAQMKAAAKQLKFEKAALLRDRIIELRKDEELTDPLAGKVKR
jgi:excinuclease ABC subunit B